MSEGAGGLRMPRRGSAAACWARDTNAGEDEADVTSEGGMTDGCAAGLFAVVTGSTAESLSQRVMADDAVHGERGDSNRIESIRPTATQRAPPGKIMHTLTHSHTLRTHMAKTARHEACAWVRRLAVTAGPMSRLAGLVGPLHSPLVSALRGLTRCLFCSNSAAVKMVCSASAALVRDVLAMGSRDAARRATGVGPDERGAAGCD